MTTFEFLSLGALAVALLMGLAALSAFLWALASGAFGDVEASRHQVLRAEAGDEAPGPGGEA